MKKIAVLRANGIGDVITSLPAIKALKRAYPASELVLLGRKLHADLFRDCQTVVDRIIPLPKSLCFDKPLNQDSYQVQVTLEQLRDEQFDLAVQLHGGGRYSNHFVTQLQAGLTLGAKTPDALSLSLNLPYVQFQHEIFRQLEIVSQLGLNASSHIPRLELKNKAKEKSFQRLRDRYGEGKKFVLVNPGARDPRRRWPSVCYAEVSNRLVSEDRIILLNVSDDEVDVLEELQKHLVAPLRKKILVPDLSDLPGLLACCQLVLSNDTGTSHLAMALDIPTVALFWFKNLLHYVPLTAIKNRVLVSWETCCPSCGRSSLEQPCDHPDSLLASIKVADVLAVSEELLSREDKNEEHQSRRFHG